MALHGPLGKALGLAESVAPKIARGAANVATLGAYEHPHESVQYVINTLKSMDPRTRAGVLNWAAMFTPNLGGGPGGKFSGMTTKDWALMNQLRSADPVKTKGGGSSYLPIGGRSGNTYSEGVTPGDVVPGTASHSLARQLGYSTGSPGTDLLFPSRLNTAAAVSGNLRPFTDTQRGMSPSQLGLEQTEPPATAFGGQHPGTVEGSYQTMPRDQVLTNMLLSILRGGRRN